MEAVKWHVLCRAHARSQKGNNKIDSLVAFHFRVEKKISYAINLKWSIVSSNKTNIGSYTFSCVRFFLLLLFVQCLGNFSLLFFRLIFHFRSIIQFFFLLLFFSLFDTTNSSSSDMIEKKMTLFMLYRI